MYKSLEKISTVALGAMCLVNGYTFGLAAICAVELYSGIKAANNNEKKK